MHYVAKKADAWVSLDMIKFKVPTPSIFHALDRLPHVHALLHQALPKEPESEAGWVRARAGHSRALQLRLHSLTILLLQAPFGATIPIMARKYLLVKAKVARSRTVL